MSARTVKSDKVGRPDQLLVFSDDWGRHPSSCQHLVGRLLGRYPTLWVNTVGTRRPRLSREDVGKAMVKLGQWLGPAATQADAADRPTVISPWMYPGFRRRWQRRFNASRLAAQVNRAIDRCGQASRRVAITTVPVTADLIGRLHVDRWVYYCVDDFSVWPGLDSRVLDDMERKLVASADAIVAVSQTLQKRIGQMGRQATLLTHGIDIEHWSSVGESAAGIGTTARPAWWPRRDGPVMLFWGVVDRRLDVDCCLSLTEQCGRLVLVGPMQSPPSPLTGHDRIVMPGPVPYADLPALAQAADVLVMPYADLPVTRAIQPLKFKEYMATGKPVVVSRLPATANWADAADVCGDTAGFCDAVRYRIAHGVDDSQRQARRRLGNESWQAKAAAFERVIVGSSETAGQSDGGFQRQAA